MDEKDWLILQAIYEEGNITKAASRLYISQPALTYRLQQMEESLGVKIIVRGKKGVKFTQEGEYLAKYAIRMLLELQKTRDYILNMSGKIEGVIRIGVSNNFARYKLPKILASFLEKYPDVQFHVNTGWSSEIFQLVHSETVHIGIIRGDYNWLDEKVLIDKEHMVVISKNKIELEQLEEMPRISYKTDPLLQQAIDNWWYERYNQPPKVTMQVDKIDTCKEMVAHGLGYAIIPSIGLKPHDQLQTIHLTNKHGEPLWRNTWMIYRKSELKFPVIETFVNFLKEYREKNRSAN